MTLLAPEDGAKWRQLERGLGRRVPRTPWPGAGAALDGSARADAVTRLEAGPAAVRERGPAMPTRRDPSASSASSAGSARSPRPAPERPRPAAAPTPRPSGSLQLDRGHAQGRAASTGPDRAERARPAPDVTTQRGARPPSGPEQWDDGADAQWQTAASDPRALLSAHGRDPHRPSWAAERERVNAAPPAEDGRAPIGDAPGRPRGRRRGGAGRSGERHETVCAACGRPAQVPFRPDPSRPVYCDDCFRTRRADRRGTEAATAGIPA